jgi:L-rhamnose mutarotase
VERICFTFPLEPGREDEYKRRHDEIWPELVDAIREAGIRNYSLFRRGLQVIAYAECHPDAATAFGKVGSTDVNRRSAESFEDVIDRLVDEEGQPFRADEVWQLDQLDSARLRSSVATGSSLPLCALRYAASRISTVRAPSSPGAQSRASLPSARSTRAFGGPSQS